MTLKFNWGLCNSVQVSKSSSYLMAHISIGITHFFCDRVYWSWTNSSLNRIASAHRPIISPLKKYLIKNVNLLIISLFRLSRGKWYMSYRCDFINNVEVQRSNTIRFLVGFDITSIHTYLHFNELSDTVERTCSKLQSHLL